mgnify:CR=1 FL=1|jgi:hypothetical protein
MAPTTDDGSFISPAVDFLLLATVTLALAISSGTLLLV